MIPMFIKWALFSVAVSFIALAVSANENKLFVLEKPDNVQLIDCKPSCDASLSDITAVASAAALKSLTPSSPIPWISAFGISAQSRPNGVVVVTYDGSSKFPISSTQVYDLVFDQDDNRSSKDLLFEDHALNLAQISLKSSSEDNVELFNNQLQQFKQDMGPNLLVLGVQISNEVSSRKRRSAQSGTDADDDTADVETVTADVPINVYNFRKEGAAADFEFAIWFTIVFTIIILVICILLMQIGQGDDSVIYKTTNAKMGKRD